jgi:hypothetical protein|tara:strand:- start:970 stop:1590 length:621 start_codon:yes stop_codon:yes gene_type:complete
MDFTNKKKERSDMILEPLQVMVQLALLSYSPIGTKVSVADNILHLQFPTMFQGVWRWYNLDGKDDLYYLFHAIRRYYKWYKSQNNKIFSFILHEAIKGLENLMITYEKSNQTSIIHTLKLYKNVLGMESPDLFKENTEETINIDKVFENIKNIYDQKLLKVIYNITQLCNDADNVDEKKYMVDGLLSVLIPTNEKIRIWIRQNLTC